MNETSFVSLREMIEAMKKYSDDDVFRWFQDSYPAPDGSVQAGRTLCVTIGQVRKELGIKENGNE